MSNRLLFWLTCVAILGLGILLFMNAIPMIWAPNVETYLKLNDVRGIAVEHKNKLYTLNFEQQNELIGYLNKAIPTSLEEEKGRKPSSDISKIVIYRFNKPDLVLTPIRYDKNNLIFSSPEWNRDGFMKDVSGGNLQTLLSKTYDS